MLNLLLVRHGQSEWNAVGRWQGQADPPLSAVGRDWAQRAAQQIGSFDAIISSDLERAVHTATIISDATGVGPVLVDPHLRERHAGEYQGLTHREIEEQFPGNLAAGIWPPGWESNESLLERTFAALEAIVDHTTGTGDVLAVSHSGVIYSLEDHLGQPRERIDNLGARWFHHNDGRWTLGQRVLLIQGIASANPSTVERQAVI